MREWDGGNQQRGFSHAVGHDGSGQARTYERAPEELAVARVYRLLQDVESFAMRAEKLTAITRRDEWHAEHRSLTRARAALAAQVEACKTDETTSARAQEHHATASARLDDIDAALQAAQEPSRPVPPVAGEESIEPLIVARSARPDDVMAWVAGMSTSDRAVLAGRVQRVLQTVDRNDGFAVGLANFLCTQRILKPFYEVARNPRRFNRTEYEKARSANGQSNDRGAGNSQATIEHANRQATTTHANGQVTATHASSPVKSATSIRFPSASTTPPNAAEPIEIASLITSGFTPPEDSTDRAMVAVPMASTLAAVQDIATSPAVGSSEMTTLAGASSSGVAKSATPWKAVVHEIAEHGLSGPPVPLPHLDRIQASFGQHDVSRVQAHVGGAAAEASAAMGAVAYAIRDHVAFASAPDLHTAAHEAAHTVQQRGAVQLRGVDADQEDDERHADAVADRVVRGESAERLLDDAMRSGWTVHQKKVGHDTGVGKDKAKPELIRQNGAEWPVFAETGKPYMIQDRDGKPGFWAVREWITTAADLEQQTHKRTKRTTYVAPSRAREILGAMGWVAADKIEFAAKQITFEFHGALSHFVVGAESAFATGLPRGREAVVDRDREGGLIITVALDDEDIAPGTQHQATASEVTRAFRAAASFTGLDIEPQGQLFLISVCDLPVGMTGNGVLAMTLDHTACRTLFGMAAYDIWAGGKKTRAVESKTSKAPKLKLENFYKRPIPGQLMHYGDIVESGEAVRLEVLVDWPHESPNPEIFDAPPMVTPSKFGSVAAMSCTWRFERIDSIVSGRPETMSTSVAEAVRSFRLAPGESTGTFRVTCDAHFSEYFAPATFTRDIVVMSSAEAMRKLKSEAFVGLGAPDADRRKDSWTGDARIGFKGSPVPGSHSDVDDSSARDRAGQRERLQNVADYLRSSPASEEAVQALDRELARQTRTEELLADDRAKGWQTFQIRGTYLSRTEGLASGPLDLHGTVHIERHYDSYAGDGPSTTMRMPNDQTVVRIRDLSRRFEQSDFVFEGKSSTFDDALKQAFDDLAIAYPKGVVSIEAEQINGRALTSPEGAGLEAARDPSTGKVIGFQRSTETIWKSVKEIAWDPVASIAVNFGAIALMTLVPGSAAIVAPALVAYNSIPSVDRVKSEADRGTLTLGTFAMSAGEVVLNLLPLVARAKPFTAGWYMVETANWGGQVALMGVSAVDVAQQIHATQVAALAQQYQQFLELRKNSLPSDPLLAIEEARMLRKAAELDDEIRRQFWTQVTDNFFQMAAGSVIHNTSAHARTAILEHLGVRSGGGGGAMAAPSRLATTAAAERRIRSDDNADGNGFRADPVDLYNVYHEWSSRNPDDILTPIRYQASTHAAYFDICRNGERIGITADLAPVIKTAVELTSTSNRIVGHPVSASDGHNILRALNESRLEALAVVGVNVSPDTMLPRDTEFGLGEIDGGEVVVVLGEHAAVDWAHLPGITPKAHTHPSVPGNDLLENIGSESVPLARILEPTRDPLIARELVLPSPPDVAVMARFHVDGHRVITPFVVRDGNVMKPKSGDNAPRLEWVIAQPREVGRTAEGSTVYEATLIGEVAGKPVAQVKIWSTEPTTPMLDSSGNHYMVPPEMTPTVKPGTGPKRTPTGGSTLTATEVAALSNKHGNDAVDWAGETLDGVLVRRLLNALDPPVVAGMRDVSAAEALRNLEVFGKSTLEKAVPPLTGNQLKVEREQLGARVAMGVVKQKLNGKVSKPDDLAVHADNLASATAKPHEALTNDSLVVDNNVLVGIKELMSGMAWDSLQDLKKKGINWLRAHAKPSLPPLEGDPQARGLTDLIGNGHDLRASNVVLGEHAPMVGLKRAGFEITIDRDSAQYRAVLDELARDPEPIGQKKGDADRATVADAMFGAGLEKPTLMTGDYSIIERLYKRYGRGKIRMPNQKHEQKAAQAIAELHPNGFEAVIPDGLGGTRTITIVPMVT